MSEKLEQIKKLQTEVFVEERGVSREQANKLVEYMVYERVLDGSDPFWNPHGKESLMDKIARVQKENMDLNKSISEMEWEHKKLWMGTVFFTIATSAAIVFIFSQL